MNSAPDVVLVIPCYNEAARLDVDTFRQFAAQRPGIHLLFVDDGSSDKTLEVLDRLRSGLESSISILRCTQNGGKAQAVRLGILKALDDFSAPAIGFWDADLATPLETAPQFVQILAEKPEIEMVFGARVQLLGRKIERLAARHYAGRVFATAVSLTLRLPIYDSQCGAKLFRVTGQTRKIFAEPFLSKWVFDVEILARYLAAAGGDPHLLERMIYEYPLERWVDVAGSKVRPKDFVTAAVDLLRIRRKYL